jgi:hypothetical protein
MNRFFLQSYMSRPSDQRWMYVKLGLHGKKRIYFKVHSGYHLKHIQMERVGNVIQLRDPASVYLCSLSHQNVSHLILQPFVIPERSCRTKTSQKVLQYKGVRFQCLITLAGNSTNTDSTLKTNSFVAYFQPAISAGWCIWLHHTSTPRCKTSL